MAPFIHLDGDAPRLSRSTRRRLRDAEDLIRQRGIYREIRFDYDPRHIAGLRRDVTAAYKTRNLDAGRPIDLAAWKATHERATVMATLWLDGRIAAWDLAAPDPPGYLILAGQMVPGFDEYEPGRMLEKALIEYVFADPAYLWIDWGSPEHADTLIAVS